MMWPTCSLLIPLMIVVTGDDVDAGFVQVVDGLQFHVEQVADLAVRVGGVADAVELEVDVTETRLGSGAAKFLALGKLDAVGGCLHAVITHLAGVGPRRPGSKETR